MLFLCRVTFLLLSIATFFPDAAMAAEDIFDDRQRPWVYGDRNPERRDMFEETGAWYPPTSRDMFGVTQGYVTSDSDVFGRNPNINIYGVNDMFTPEPLPVPPSSLYTWPTGHSR